MRPLHRIISVCLIVLTLFTCYVSAYADTGEDTLVQLDNEQLFEQMKDGKFIHNDSISTWKLNETQKNNYLRNCKNIDIDSTNVYVIERSLSEQSGEINVITDLVVHSKSPAVPVRPGVSTMGEYSDTGSASHVVVTAIVGFDKRTYNNVEYRRGTYYGGYINETPLNTAITSLTGTYKEVGAWVGANNNNTGIQASPLSVSTNFDTSKSTTRQTASLSRSKCYSTTATGTMLGSIFTAKGKLSTNYQFTATAYVYAIRNDLSL